MDVLNLGRSVIGTSPDDGNFVGVPFFHERGLFFNSQIFSQIGTVRHVLFRSTNMSRKRKKLFRKAP
jgi:hypothetical protein